LTCKEDIHKFLFPFEISYIQPELTK